ncbi:hypothetical protein BH09BAC4_BH09BAC4_33290 [soil metagenome]
MLQHFTHVNKVPDERQIYLVDDDQDDVFIFEKALLEIFPTCQLRHFGNGLVMLELMAEPGNEPHLIFLDMNMPYPDGLEVLMSLKINKVWAHIPVIMFTGNEDPTKAKLAYQLGAQTVIQKPDHYDQLVEILQVVRQYWFKMAYLAKGQA